VSAVELATRPTGNASTAIQQAFAAQDRLGELASREALFAACFRVPPALRVAQVAAMRDGRFQPEGSELRLEGGLPFEATADAGTLRLLQLSDGRRTLGEIVGEMGGPQTSGFAESVGETARRLVTLGFLVPAEEAGEGRKDEVAIGFEPEAHAAAPRAPGSGRARRPRRRAAGLGAG
jgi:hypothetical protein